MNISLPDGLKTWAEHRVSEGRYASTSDYIRDLIRRDEEDARDLAWLQAEIDKGLASGIDPRSHEEIFAEIRGRHFAKAS